jgi:hypothetical protein
MNRFCFSVCFIICVRRRLWRAPKYLRIFEERLPEEAYFERRRLRQGLGHL